MPANATVANPDYYTSAMSYQEWKREPTTTQVLFGLQLPYRPPRSLLGKFFWRQRVWVEVTFALSMLEPWEKFLVSEYTPLYLCRLFAFSSPCAGYFPSLLSLWSRAVLSCSVRRLRRTTSIITR